MSPNHRDVYVELESVDGKRVPATITYSRRAPWSLHLTAPGFNAREVQASDLFECLVDVRRELEKIGYRLLCNAARLDVYPSGMVRQMGGGVRAYVLRMGHPGESSDMVNIFEPAASDVVASVDDQREYFERWGNSLG